VTTQHLSPDPKARIAAAIAAARSEILDLSHRIHADPEAAFEEHRSAALVAEALRRHGYEVQHPAGSLATAVRAVRAGGRGDGPTVAVLAEYDALPGLGHGCGHNLMAAAGVGAAIGLASVLEEVGGTVVVLGTPAEEYGSGKERMLADGLFAGVDAALQFHPSDVTESRCGLLALVDVDVTFTGLEAHAAGEPWMGRNALDALVLLLVSIGLWRQRLRPHARVHGIVIEGGDAPNIIPSRTRARFMLRSPEDAELAELEAEFRRQAEAAALASRCEHSVAFGNRSRPMKDSEVLRRAWVANQERAGIPDDDRQPDLSGSSDMGNVSQVVPTIHPYLAICEPGIPGHSIEFRDAAASSRADEVAVLAATITAQTAWDLLSDPALIDAAWAEFHESGPGVG
jgi:amidohydrolase